MLILEICGLHYRRCRDTINQMNKKNLIISKEEQARLVEALKAIRQRVQWKTGKDITHLKKRQGMGHIPLSASILDYEKTISEVVTKSTNIVYLYEYMRCNYYGVRGFAHEKEWLVILGPDGIMETAFPPENMDDYLNKRGFIFIGPIKEVLKWI